MNKEFLTLEEIAEILRVSKMTIYRYIKSGKIIAYKFGKKFRIKNSDYKIFLERSKINNG